MRKYTMLDMVRMGKFAKSNPNLQGIALIKAYNVKHPEISAEEQLRNIHKFFNSGWFDFEKEKPCGCKGDCACDENFEQTEKLKQKLIKNP